MAYNPAPIDTSYIILPSDILLITEKLAKNTHENWAAQRLRDGWSYGSVRDDIKKFHPCLVSYDELPESERDYDRLTALETLKAVCALGFQIVSVDEGAC